MVSETKTRDEVLRLLRDGRSKLETALQGVPEDDATKAMLAHVTYWEHVMVRHLGGVEPPIGNCGSTDLTNAAVAAHASTRPFGDVRREFDAIYRQLVERIEALTDERINSTPVPGRDTVVWQYIAGETWGHYPEHVAQLEARAKGG